MTLLERLHKRIEKKLPKKTWLVSQAYEWRATQEFMETPFFAEIMDNFRNGKFDALKGYRDPSIIKEFFANSVKDYEDFLNRIAGKSRLDVGPCISTPLRQWGVSEDNFVIEPLHDKVRNYQTEQFEFSLFDDFKCFNTPAEVTIESLINRIDGVIFCRNCIDHSPSWPFILANISKYAAKGCYLMLWNDLNHGGEADDGHYEITTESNYFRNLIEALGFQIVNEYIDKTRTNLNFGCLAIKK